MKKYYLLFFLLCLYACRSDMPSINPKQMSKLLTEIHLADAYAQLAPRDSSENSLKNTDSLKLYYSRIFKLNKTTEQEFMRNMVWYQEHPDKLDSVYQMTLNEIKARSILLNRK